MCKRKWLTLIIPLFMLALTPLAYAHTITVPTNAYFGFGNGTYINFNTQQTFDTVYRQNGYWYFDSYAFHVENANLTITSLMVNNQIIVNVQNLTTATWQTIITYATPTYVLNASYTTTANTVNFTGQGSKTITVSYVNWGDFYIRSVEHPITSIGWEGEKLTLTIKGATGASGTLTVSCGSRGVPKRVAGLTNLIYNADTKVLTGTYTFSSVATVVLDWTTETGTPSGGTTTIGKLDITVEDTRLSVVKGGEAEFNLTVHWTGVNDVAVSKVTVTEEYVAWFSLAETLPKYASKTSADTEGTVTIAMKIAVPWQATTGQHTIPVTVSISQEGGITIEKSGVIYLTILSAAPSTAGIPEIMTWLFLAVVLGLSAYAFIKKR